MADRKFFRTTFRGFSKADVLEHIDTLRAQQQEELKEMQGQVAQAQEQCEAARAEAAAVAALPAEQLAELEELRVKVAAYEQEIAQLKAQLEESDQTRSALWQQQSHLQQCVEQAEAFAADVQALSDQLAVRVGAYVGKPAAETPAVPTPETVDEAPVPAAPEETASPKTEMADWLY